MSLKNLIGIALLSGLFCLANAQSRLPGIKTEDINLYLRALDFGYQHQTDRNARLPDFFLEGRENTTLMDTLTHNHIKTEVSEDKTRKVIYPHSWLEFSRIHGRGMMDMIIVGEYEGKNYPLPVYIIFYEKKRGIQIYDFGFGIKKKWDKNHFREILQMRKEELETKK